MTTSTGWLDLLATNRIAAMREFLLGWYPGPAPVPPTPGLPVALAELYAIAAGRPDVMGTQNGLYAPDELRTDPHEGLLVFAAENQGNFSWMIDPTEEDPVVWLVRQRAHPVAEREQLSGFLVQFCLLEALMSGPLNAFCWSEPLADPSRVTAELQEVPLAPWHWPGDPTRFFVASDLVLCTCAHDDGHVDILAGARTPDALATLAGTGVPWDHYDG